VSIKNRKEGEQKEEEQKEEEQAIDIQGCQKNDTF
jgi:hypothetical protein